MEPRLVQKAPAAAQPLGAVMVAGRVISDRVNAVSAAQTALKNIVFVGGTITSGATGYTSIDNIGTSLLLAVPAYTNVTFKGITFENVMSFDYQL